MNIKLTQEEIEIINQFRDLMADSFVKAGVVSEACRLIEHTDGHALEIRWHAKSPQSEQTK